MWCRHALMLDANRNIPGNWTEVVSQAYLLGPADAVVVHLCTPPPAAYFSLDAYIGSRYLPGEAAGLGACSGLSDEPCGPIAPPRSASWAPRPSYMVWESFGSVSALLGLACGCRRPATAYLERRSMK